MSKVEIDKGYLDFLEEKVRERNDLKRELAVIKWLYRNEMAARVMGSDDWEAYYAFIADDWVKLDQESKEAEMLYADAMAKRTEEGQVAFSRFIEDWKDFKDYE